MVELEKLFGGGGIIKILKFFILNPEAVIDARELSKRTKVSLPTIKRELTMLNGIRFVKERSVSSEHGKRKKKGWQLNSDFKYLRSLRNLLISAQAFDKEKLARRFRDVGRVKLILASGVFIQQDDSRVDLLIVGDLLKRNIIEQKIRKMEAEIGKELSYAICDTADFDYRLHAYDRFVRDILDFPYEKVIDRIGLPEK